MSSERRKRGFYLVSLKPVNKNKHNGNCYSLIPAYWDGKNWELTGTGATYGDAYFAKIGAEKIPLPTKIPK